MPPASCPHCGAENIPGELFCHTCDKALPGILPAAPRALGADDVAATAAGRALLERALRRRAARIGNTLFTIATIAVLLAGMVLLGHNDLSYASAVEKLIPLAILGLGLVLALLGILARYRPLPAVVTAVVLLAPPVIMSLALLPTMLPQYLPLLGPEVSIRQPTERIGFFAVMAMYVAVGAALTGALAAALRHRRLASQLRTPGGDSLP